MSARKKSSNLLVATITSILFLMVMLYTKCNEEKFVIPDVAELQKKESGKQFKEAYLNRNTRVNYSFSKTGKEQAFEMIDGFYEIDGNDFTFDIDGVTARDKLQWQRIESPTGKRIYLGLPMHDISPLSKVVLEGDVLFIEFLNDSNIMLVTEEDYYLQFRTAKPL